MILEFFHHIVYTSIEHNGHVAETLRRIYFKLCFQYQSGVLKSLKTKRYLFANAARHLIDSSNYLKVVRAEVGEF